MENEEIDEEMLDRPAEQIMNYIIEQYGEELKRLIYTYVKNHAQTDDIFQDVLIKVYKTIDHFERKSKLKTWLYRIAINKCKDYLRSPIHRLLPYYDHSNSPKADNSAEQQAIVNEQEIAIVDAILALPIKYREIFVLKYYQSFSINQISVALQMKESTVKTRILRGKKKLRLKLGGDYLEEYEK